jgi:hypothetical protein
VVRLVRDEVCRHVADVERKISPDVGRGCGHDTSLAQAKPQDILDPAIAAAHRDEQRASRDRVQIHERRPGDAEGHAERLDPSAARVVQMRGDHANRTPRHSRNALRPDRARQLRNEQSRDATVGAPGLENEPIGGCGLYFRA